MALPQQLAQFTKQQEKLQASLASLPTRPKATSPSPSASRKAPSPPPRSQSHVPLAQRFSFTHDTEKLQEVATIQKSPVGAQIKRVLDLLLETRQPLLPAEIYDLCFVNVKNNKDVFESLKSNPKVSFDGQRFAFRSKLSLTNKEELLALVSKFPYGVPMGDLKDSYLGIQADVQALKATGEVLVLKNSDSQEDIVYPNDPQVAIKDLKQLFRRIDIPRAFTNLDRALEKARMEPTTNSAYREAMAGIPGSQIPKKRRESKRTKYTNAHMSKLFNAVEEP